MEPYESLFRISKVLLQASQKRTPELLLREVLEWLGAERGFIVVREADQYVQRFQVGFEESTREEQSFSKSIVKRVLRSGEVIHSRNLQDDGRFDEIESVRGLGEWGILVAPLQHGGETYGAVYVQHKRPLNVFSDEASRFLSEFAEIAALSIKRALEVEEMQRRSQELTRDLFARHEFPGIVTADPKMLELLEIVAQVADSDATVLVRGESGTGKELVVRALHLNSPRRDRPFSVIHCNALPATMLESELFGHKRGAFTGADRDRPGRIASADGGTVFLDEIAEIPLELQAKLLRLLQFGELQRVGSDGVEMVDVRIIAATHRPLSQLIEEGRFRHDLYYRLKVVELEVPSLRDRKSDIPLLVDHFTKKFWKRDAPPTWTPEALRLLTSFSFPGNVRELEHVVQRVCLLARSPELGPELLPPEIVPQLSGLPWSAFPECSNDELKRARERAQDLVERAFLSTLIERHRGNVSEASRQSGISRPYLQRLIARHRPFIEDKPSS